MKGHSNLYLAIKNFRKRKIVSDFYDFFQNFSGELIIFGCNVDYIILDLIKEKTNNDLKKLSKIVFVTSLLNINKKFDDSFTGLSRFLYELDIKLEIKVVNSEFQEKDIFFFDKKNICKVIRSEIDPEKKIRCYTCKKEEILELYKICNLAIDITHIRGNEVYIKKYDKVFQISDRNLSNSDKEQLYSAFLRWETSNFDDIMPFIKILELKIRDFIKLRLVVKNPKWFSICTFNIFSPQRQKEIMNRFESTKSIHINEIDDHQNPLCFLTLSEYPSVINANNWGFKDYLSKDNAKYRGYLSDCQNIRQPQAHFRDPTDNTDFYSDSICKILMYIEFLNKLEPKLIK